MSRKYFCDLCEKEICTADEPSYDFEYYTYIEKLDYYKRYGFELCEKCYKDEPVTKLKERDKK